MVVILEFFAFPPFRCVGVLMFREIEVPVWNRNYGGDEDQVERKAPTVAFKSTKGDTIAKTNSLGLVLAADADSSLFCTDYAMHDSSTTRSLYGVVSVDGLAYINVYSLTSKPDAAASSTSNASDASTASPVTLFVGVVAFGYPQLESRACGQVADIIISTLQPKHTFILSALPRSQFVNPNSYTAGRLNDVEPPYLCVLDSAMAKRTYASILPASSTSSTPSSASTSTSTSSSSVSLASTKLVTPKPLEQPTHLSGLCAAALERCEVAGLSSRAFVSVDDVQHYAGETFIALECAILNLSQSLAALTAASAPGDASSPACTLSAALSSLLLPVAQSLSQHASAEERARTYRQLRQRVRVELEQHRLRERRERIKAEEETADVLAALRKDGEDESGPAPPGTFDPKKPIPSGIFA